MLSYIGERWTTFTKAYGTKVRCYGEHVKEHIGNLMGTHWELEQKWEHLGNQVNMKKSSPKLIRKKSKAPWVHAWAFPLAAWNFSSEKSSSPFLAWANTPCKEHTTYQGKHFLCKMTGILNNKTPTTGRELSKRFFGVDGFFDWPITKTCAQTSGTFKINMSYLVFLFGLLIIGYNRTFGQRIWHDVYCSDIENTLGT